MASASRVRFVVSRVRSAGSFFVGTGLAMCTPSECLLLKIFMTRISGFGCYPTGPCPALVPA